MALILCHTLLLALAVDHSPLVRDFLISSACEKISQNFILKSKHQKMFPLTAVEPAIENFNWKRFTRSLQITPTSSAFSGDSNKMIALTLEDLV